MAHRTPFRGIERSFDDIHEVPFTQSDQQMKEGH